MNNNLFWIVAFIIVLGGFILVRYLFPVKDNSDIVDDMSDDKVEENQENTPSDVVNVPGHSFLGYSKSTRYVYTISFTGDAKIFDMYISNEHFCQYLGGKIVEVVGDEIVAIVYKETLPD